MTVAHARTHMLFSTLGGFALFDKHSDQAEVRNETEAAAFTASWGILQIWRRQIQQHHVWLHMRCRTGRNDKNAKLA